MVQAVVEVTGRKVPEVVHLHKQVVVQVVVVTIHPTEVLEVLVAEAVAEAKPYNGVRGITLQPHGDPVLAVAVGVFD
jgi:hypothetical protein